MDLPSLSVVIPNYNHGRHLPDCLASVMNQSVLPTEVIVIDDGSTDNSSEVLEDLSRKYPLLKVYKNEKNLGIWPTINRGVDLCSGDCYLSLGADDLVMPGLFEKALNLMTLHPEAALCGAICEFEDIGRNLKYYLGLNVAEKSIYFTPEDLIKKSREAPLMIFASPMILRRRLLIEAGKFYPEMKWCSDWFSSWVIGYEHGICFIPEVLGRFTKYSTSYSGKGMQSATERREIYQAMLDHLLMPRYAIAAERMRRAAALGGFGKDMIWLMARRKKYWCFLTPLCIGRALWMSFKIGVKELLPDRVARWCMHLAGYGSRPKNADVNSQKASAH